jgi:hypothetical protein
MKKYFILIVVLIIVVGIYFYFAGKAKVTEIIPVENNQMSDVQNFQNATFTIEGQTIHLQNGKSEQTIATSSASKVITQYFGNEATGDLNSDGVADAAFLVTQTNGGSGTFFYVVAALKNSNGYTYTNAFFIGDRIAPQSTNINANELYVNFAERKTGEPMTTQPSVGATLLLKVTPNGILEGLMK